MSLLSGDIKKVVLNLGGVERVNSAGLLGWMKFLARIQARYTVSFSELGEALLEQAIIHTGVLGRPGSQVESFQVGYRCSRCDNVAFEVLLTTHYLDLEGFTPPARNCDDCETLMELDNLESSYTSFLKTIQKDRRIPRK